MEPGLALRADALRGLHRGARPLVLANAWDARSARLVVAAGFPVVATSSAALVTSLGYEDGSQADPDAVFAALARITRAVDVPVTADVEDGYGLAPDQLAQRLLDAGAVGCNLEDSDHTKTGEPLVPAEQFARGCHNSKPPGASSGSISSSTPGLTCTSARRDHPRRASTRRCAAPVSIWRPGPTACTPSR